VNGFDDTFPEEAVPMIELSVMAAPFEGFEEIRAHHPAAVALELAVPYWDVRSRECTRLTMACNADAFAGKPPRTLLHVGTDHDGAARFARRVFVFNPDGWPPTYPAADFAPLMPTAAPRA
jgi:hypothetical protein